MMRKMSYICVMVFIVFSVLDAEVIKKQNGNPSYCPSKKNRGFIGGAAGVKRYEKYAPTRIKSNRQLNQPLGQVKADKIARALGLEKDLCFTQEQYLTFISGQGANGSGNLNDAKLVDQSVNLLTNTCENPLIRMIDGEATQIILGSYGLTVNEAGMLESLANPDSPAREVNAVITPGGYLSKWCKANGAEESLAMLYRSAYSRELPYAIVAQHEGTDAELVLYLDCSDSAFTGISVCPSIWVVNFCLIYTLNPKLAANMPAYWAPIPKKIVRALEKSSNGQVPFSDYALYLKSGKCKKGTRRLFKEKSCVIF